ncbi:MAG: hypothetical protein ACKPKO_39790, partial [Candidatus Fonsibacter sp.]
QIMLSHVGKDRLTRIRPPNRRERRRFRREELYKVPRSLISEICTSILNNNNLPKPLYMDVVRLIHKALSDEDIGTILGTDANIILYSELRHITDLNELLTRDLDYCIILYEDRPDGGRWAALSRYNGIYEHFDS